MALAVFGSLWDLASVHYLVGLVLVGWAVVVLRMRKTWLKSILPVKKPAGPRTATADYSEVYPPSQRHVLAQIKREAVDTSPASIAVSLSARAILGFEDDYRVAADDRLLYSGFTVKEVKSLGAFPDYARLSGVPLPNPLPEFEIGKSTPRPYRPFRWAYHQTMCKRRTWISPNIEKWLTMTALTKMDSDYWLELESTYIERIRQRQRLLETEGKLVLDALPGSELACKELMEMCIQFLCARYPSQFKLEGNTFTNSILGTRHELDNEDPLHVLINNVPEDFALMLRDPKTGRYMFRAGIICSSVGWTLGTKMGMDLESIHSPVPDYKQNMAFSMDRFFTKMPTANPIQRGSWGLEMGQPLYLPADHPDIKLRESQYPSLTPEDVYLRVDWQTLRRLPLSGAIVFNFKALFTPLTEFKDEPYIPSLVLKVLEDGKESIMKYKGTWHVEHVVKPTLRAYRQQQVESGMIEEDWEPRTLDEAPFFAGWQRKHVVG